MLLFTDPFIIQHSTYIQRTIFCHLLSKIAVVISYVKILIMGVSSNKQTKISHIIINHIIKFMTQLLQVEITDTVFDSCGIYLKPKI